MPIDFEKCPESCRHSMKLYIEARIPVGHYLTAILTNDLRGAFNRGDEASIKDMPALMKFLYNDVPAICQGSKERVEKWLAKMEQE